MEDLPPSVKKISFTDTDNAFQCNWKKHFGLDDAGGSPDGPSAGPAPLAASLRPQALSSVVAFYITHRPFTTVPMTVDFADQVIAEPLPGESTSIDPGLAALLADVRLAGVAEALTVFHVPANPVLTASPDALIERLASLPSKGILTALIIDRDIWPGLRGAGDATVEQILRSPYWTGPALVPAVDDPISRSATARARR